MEKPCDSCKHKEICELDDDYVCTALWIANQFPPKDEEPSWPQVETVSFGLERKKAYRKNLQYVKQQFKKRKR